MQTTAQTSLPVPPPTSASRRTAAPAVVRTAALSVLARWLPPGPRTLLENIGAPRELVATWRQLRRGGAPVSLWRVARGWS